MADTDRKKGKWIDSPVDLGTELEALAYIVTWGIEGLEALQSKGLVDYCFVDNRYRTAFKACLSLQESQETIDVLMLKNQMVRDQVDDSIIEVVLKDISTRETRQFEYSVSIARVLVTLYKLRKVRKILTDADQIISERGTTAEEVLKQLETQLRLIPSAVEGEAEALSQVLDIVIDSWEKGVLSKTIDIKGLQTGFIDLDQQINGLEANDLIVVAGRPSMGKSALALNIAAHIALSQKKNVLFFSFEMGKKDLALRILTAEAYVNAHLIKNGIVMADLNDKQSSDVQAVKKVYSMLKEGKGKIYIDGGKFSSSTDIIVRTKRLYRKLDGNLSAVFIDYLQLMSEKGFSRGENRNLELSAITRKLKLMAEELGIPVVILSQLNRGVELRQDKRPMMADLRDSGGIEQDADKILLLYRPEYYKKRKDAKRAGLAEVIVAKHRNGPTGTVILAWCKAWARFLTVLYRDPENSKKEE